MNCGSCTAALVASVNCVEVSAAEPRFKPSSGKRPSGSHDRNEGTCFILCVRAAVCGSVDLPRLSMSRLQRRGQEQEAENRQRRRRQVTVYSSVIG